MSVQSKELSPVSMITEKLANFHITENSGLVNAFKSLDVKKYFFGKASSLLLPKTSDEKDLSDSVSSNYSCDCSFYAVNIPRESVPVSEGGGDSDLEIPIVFQNIEEALKMVKTHKHARFKSFTSREEAVEFSLDSANSESFSKSTTISEDEDGLSSVKCQDLVKLRKAIEDGNENYFKELVWENARYLVNYHGDTPSILQEGFRYNALHIAARNKKPQMCQLILDTLDNPKFFDRIYKCDSEIREEKIHHLQDQYLNNPDKRLGETPLHFASKFGCLDTVRILLSHPYCLKDKKNKYGETAAQTICTRCPSSNETLRQNIEEVFKGLVYVPVLRAENNVIPPCIERPCSKTEIKHKFSVLKHGDISEDFLVKAFAGPMAPDTANTFYKLWKNPSTTLHHHSYTIDEQKCIHKIRLTDTEKGLERVGRNIAKDLNVDWLEYWPVLNTFIDLSSTEGLNRLEMYLKNYKLFSFSENSIAAKEKCKSLEYDLSSSVSYKNPLGHYLNSILREDINEEELEDVFYTPPTTPENSPKLQRSNFQTFETDLFEHRFDLSRLDIDMFLAIRDIDIDFNLHPRLFEWKKYIYSKLKSFENYKSTPKSLTPLATVRTPRLQRRTCKSGISPRNLFLKSE